MVAPLMHAGRSERGPDARPPAVGGRGRAEPFWNGTDAPAFGRHSIIFSASEAVIMPIILEFFETSMHFEYRMSGTSRPAGVL